MRRIIPRSPKILARAGSRKSEDGGMVERTSGDLNDAAASFESFPLCQFYRH